MRQPTRAESECTHGPGKPIKSFSFAAGSKSIRAAAPKAKPSAKSKAPPKPARSKTPEKPVQKTSLSILSSVEKLQLLSQVGC